MSDGLLIVLKRYSMCFFIIRTYKTMIADINQVNCTEKFSDDEDLQKVYVALLEACEQITMHIRYNTSNKITTANDFGDVQLDFDV